jgi:hypothetical protein
MHLKQYDSYQDLVALGGSEENMLLGFAFEEIVAARIQVMTHGLGDPAFPTPSALKGQGTLRNSYHFLLNNQSLFVQSLNKYFWY